MNQAGLDEPPSIDEFTLEREVQETLQQALDTSVSIFTKAAMQAREQAQPSSRLYHIVMAEYERVKAIVFDVSSRTTVMSGELIDLVQQINQATLRLIADLDTPRNR